MAKVALVGWTGSLFPGLTSLAGYQNLEGKGHQAKGANRMRRRTIGVGLSSKVF
jgi:hypothetical protein